MSRPSALAPVASPSRWRCAVPRVGRRPAGRRAARPRPRPTVQIDNFAFGPQALTVSAGTTVTWINADDDPAHRGRHRQELPVHGARHRRQFSFTFTKPGRIRLFLLAPPAHDRQGRSCKAEAEERSGHGVERPWHPLLPAAAGVRARRGPEPAAAPPTRAERVPPSRCCRTSTPPIISPATSRRDATAAEDIVQEAFLRAFRGFRQLARRGAQGLAARDRAQLLPRLGRGRAAHAWRWSTPTLTRPAATGRLADDRTRPRPSSPRRSEATMLRATIESLPEPFRETLVLRELEELSYREIAAARPACRSAR